MIDAKTLNSGRSWREVWVCFGIFLFLTGLVGLGATQSFDLTMHKLIKRIQTSEMDQLMLIITLLGDTESLIILGLSSVGMVAMLGMYRAAIVNGLIMALCPVSVTILKLIIGRERPMIDLYQGASAFSFPSGHTTNSMVILGMGVWLCHKCSAFRIGRLVRNTLIGVIVMIAFSRVYLEAHWFTDIFAGLILGLFWLTLAAKFRIDGDASGKVRQSWPVWGYLAIVACVWSVYASGAFEAASKKYFGFKQADVVGITHPSSRKFTFQSTGMVQSASSPGVLYSLQNNL